MNLPIENVFMVLFITIILIPLWIVGIYMISPFYKVKFPIIRLDSNKFKIYIDPNGNAYKGIPFTICSGRRKGLSYFYIVDGDISWDKKYFENCIHDLMRSRYTPDRVFRIEKDAFKYIYNSEDYKKALIDNLDDFLYAGGYDKDGAWAEGQIIVYRGHYFVISFDIDENNEMKVSYCVEISRDSLNMSKLFNVIVH